MKISPGFTDFLWKRTSKQWPQFVVISFATRIDIYRRLFCIFFLVLLLNFVNDIILTLSWIKCVLISITKDALPLNLSKTTSFPSVPNIFLPLLATRMCFLHLSGSKIFSFKCSNYSRKLKKTKRPSI